MIVWNANINEAPKSSFAVVPNNHPKAKSDTKTVLKKVWILAWREGMEPGRTYWVPNNYDNRGGGNYWCGFTKDAPPTHWSEINKPDLD